MTDTNAATPPTDRAPASTEEAKLPIVVPPSAHLPAIVPTRRASARRRWTRFAMVRSTSTPNTPAALPKMFADQGDMVKAGQVVARMDTQDLAASLKKSEAQTRQAQRAVDEADANVTQQTTQVLLAKQRTRAHA